MPQRKPEKTFYHKRRTLRFLAQGDTLAVREEVRAAYTSGTWKSTIIRWLEPHKNTPAIKAILDDLVRGTL